ncbi:MAG TPA: lipoyl(octanoyl) transferase LipB [Thermoanaerobaculia bacterium]|nr:lipoyl(octanoyl) transferase LipB [Thermoanaerobaculia bacterium]
MRRCEIHRLHTVTYENGMKLQQKLVEMRQREEIDDQLLLLEHPPVITLGRGGDDTNLLATPPELQSHGVRFYETTRGGDITYHGPGQVVGYPILHLGEGNRDVRKYVTALEEVLIRTVAEYGITAGRVDGRRGIWVGNDKIAAIGVRIARWVSSHGWALNVNTNLDHFRLITPCGLHGTGVTSIEHETGRRVPLDDVRDVLAAKFADVFTRDLVPRPETIKLVKVLVHDRDRVLLLHRKPERGNFWQPITGTMDPSESPIETARREIVEETGHRGDPRPLDLVQSFMIESQYLAAKGYTSPIIASEVCFETHLDSTLPVSIDPVEHDEWGWFTFAEAYERIQWTDDREALDSLRSLLSVLSVVGCQLSAVPRAEALASPDPSANTPQTTDNRQPTT